MGDISCDTRCDFRGSVGNTGLKLKVWKKTLFESHSLITKQTNKQNQKDSMDQSLRKALKSSSIRKYPQGLVGPWSAVVRRGSICRDNINISMGALAFSSAKTEH